jgi:hypothetical protein
MRGSGAARRPRRSVELRASAAGDRFNLVPIRRFPIDCFEIGMLRKNIELVSIELHWPGA